MDNSIQVAELASLAQLLPPCSPTCVIRRRTALCQSGCSPIASASAAARRLHRSASTAAPRLRPLQLLLATCVCFSCYSPIVQLLPDCVRFSCCSPIASICFNCCSPFASASAAARHLCLLQLLLPDCSTAPRLRPLQLLLPDCIRFGCCSSIASASTAACSGFTCSS